MYTLKRVDCAACIRSSISRLNPNEIILKYDSFVCRCTVAVDGTRLLFVSMKFRFVSKIQKATRKKNTLLIAHNTGLSHSKVLFLHTFYILSYTKHGKTVLIFLSFFPLNSNYLTHIRKSKKKNQINSAGSRNQIESATECMLLRRHTIFKMEFERINGMNASIVFHVDKIQAIATAYIVKINELNKHNWNCVWLFRIYAARLLSR